MGTTRLREEDIARQTSSREQESRCMPQCRLILRLWTTIRICTISTYLMASPLLVCAPGNIRNHKKNRKGIKMNKRKSLFVVRRARKIRNKKKKQKGKKKNKKTALALLTASFSLVFFLSAFSPAAQT